MNSIKIAAIQMDANPAPTPERLARAESLVSKAAQAGAQLVVLPELFNTGYAYTPENYQRAEPPNGQSATWMKAMAAHLNVHLAGSLLLLDQGEIYNALLLESPDGRVWRYDKSYPWSWERAYFRNGQSTTVAQTNLGNIGLMVCWDVAHLSLWRQYAGRVDLIVVCSCPPDVGNPTYHLSNGVQIAADKMGPFFKSGKSAAGLTFGEMLDQQAAWLGVPCVNAVASGRIRTSIPNGLASFISLLPLAPWLVRHIFHASKIQMSADLVEGCKIIDAKGKTLASLGKLQGESFAMAEVNLADKTPLPTVQQPPSPLPWFAYFVSDKLIPSLMMSEYRKRLAFQPNASSPAL